MRSLALSVSGITLGMFVLWACSGGSGAGDDETVPQDTGPQICPVGTDNGTPGGDPQCLSVTEVSCADGTDNDEDAALDCADTDCATAVAAPGNCLNDADLAIYDQFDGNAEWNKCVPGPPAGEGCFVDVECNTTCLVNNTGLSPNCARCFAEVVACLIGQCAMACQGGGGSPACTECVATNCGPGYETCFGSYVCSYEYGCRDTVDNDGDGLIDGADPDCQ